MIWLCLGVFFVLLLTYRYALPNNPSKLELLLVPLLGFLFAFTMGQNIYIQTQLGLDLFEFTQAWRVEAVLILFWVIILLAWLFRAGVNHTQGRLVLVLGLFTFGSALYSAYLENMWINTKNKTGDMLIEAAVAGIALLVFVVMLLRMRHRTLNQTPKIEEAPKKVNVSSRKQSEQTTHVSLDKAPASKTMPDSAEKIESP